MGTNNVVYLCGGRRVSDVVRTDDHPKCECASVVHMKAKYIRGIVSNPTSPTISNEREENVVKQHN